MSQATVLIVDDDVTVLSRLGDLLAEAGYQVLKANEVSHATVLFDEQPPDLVLLEVGMDKGAGWHLLERFTPSVPVVVVSSRGLEEDVVRGLDAGAIDYVTKPFRSAELLARVRLRLAPRLAVPVPAPPAVESESTPSPVTRSQVQQPTDPPPVADRRTRREAAAPVVMSYADERALTEIESRPSAMAQEVSEDLPLGPRLHAARLQRRITLVQAENELNIRMYYLQAIEEEKFTLLPGVALTETFLNKYATFLSQDPKRAVEEYRRLHYTVPGTPPPALGGPVLRRGFPRWTVWLLAIVLAIAVSVGAITTFDPQGAANIEHTVRGLFP